MTRTWIVVADSARARIFSPVKQGLKLEQVKELLHAKSRVHEQELTTDRPGRSFDSAGPGCHAMSKSVSPKNHEAWKLCHELAHEIETARKQKQFDRLVLVAAPSFLGQLRKMLSEPTSQLLVRELDKNLVQMDPADILVHLPDDLWQ